MSERSWADFALIKSTITIEEVLEHYDIRKELKQRGEQLVGPCPIHGGQGRSFSVNTKDNVWQCFSESCSYTNSKGNHGGDQIDLVAALEGDELRGAALKIQEWFGLSPRRDQGRERQSGQQNKANARLTRSSEEQPAPPAVEPTRNEPLRFFLNVDSAHPYPQERGLTPETISYFELGLCSRGSMKERIAIPIHDADGQLVAYCGRWVGDGEPPEGERKYKLPPAFHKSLELFNLQRVPPERRRVTVVEGYWSVFWLHQNGFPDVVALMGSSISRQQAARLAARFQAVQLFFDGDDAGEEGCRKAIEALVPTGRWIRRVPCPQGTQPDRLPAHELKRLLT